MRFSKFVPLSMIAATALCLASCKDYVGKETSHPFYQQAETAKINKDWAKVIESYKNFMKICPESAKVHYDIALIYADNMHDYENAISHFKSYLEMAEATITQDERDSVQGAILTCKKNAFNQYRASNNIKLASDLPFSEADMAELSKLKTMEKGLKAKILEYDKVNKQLNAEKAELLAKLNKANSTIRSSASKTPAATAKNTATDKNATNETTETVATATGAQKYYTVVKGDGLQLIAKKVYGSARYAVLIENANKDKLGDRGILKIGQKLIIPPKPE